MAEGQELHWLGYANPGQGLGEAPTLAEQLHGVPGEELRHHVLVWSMKVPTVVVGVEGSETSRYLLLRDGELIDVAYWPRRENVSVLALARRHGFLAVSPDRLLALLQECAGDEAEVLRLAVERGWLASSKLQAVVRARLKMVWTEVTHHPSATVFAYGYAEGPTFHRTGGLSVISQELTFQRGELANVPMPELEARFHPHLTKRVRAHNEPHLRVETWGLDPKERTFVDEVLNRGRTLQQVLSMTTLRRRPTYELIAALLNIGYLTFESVDIAAERRAQQIERLRKKIDQFRNTHAYAALETHWSDDEPAVREAFGALVKRLELREHIGGGDPELRRLASDVLQGLETCLAGLATWEQRDHVRTGFLDASRRRMTVYLLEEQVKMSLFKGDWERARDELRRILELQPGHQQAAEQLRGL